MSPQRTTRATPSSRASLPPRLTSTAYTSGPKRSYQPLPDDANRLGQLIVELGFVDLSGGRRDAFTCAIGHRDGERAVVDVVRAWSPPFNPAGVVAESADLLRSYRISTVEGDRYAGEWPREAFRSHGIAYRPAQRNRSELYLELVSYVNGARLEIPDDGPLLCELRGLERRRGPSGKDRVDHAPGSHDDRANAVAGVAQRALTYREQQVMVR
jgi:hypothetical protein